MISYRATSSDGEEKRPIGGYVPVKTYSYIALVCFTLVSIALWTRLIRNRPRYMLVLCIGSTTMALGFVMRIVLAGNPNSLGIYIIETLFILLSPCLFLAADYVILNQLALSLGETVHKKCLLLPARLVVRIFVWTDVVTFFLQASGGGLTAMGSAATIGKTIVLIGLIVQLLSFFFFTVMLAMFGFRIKKHFPKYWNISQDGRKDWRLVLYVTGCTCIGILIRSVFRIAEFSQGYDGYIPTHESYFYLLDSLPLILSIGLFAFVWPPVYTHAVGHSGLPATFENNTLVDMQEGIHLNKPADV